MRQIRFTRSVSIVLAGIFSASLVALTLRLAWNPGARTYVEYAPVGGLLAAFVWERVFSAQSTNARHIVCDGVTIALALMRVLVPPLPYVSGHALFVWYAAVTAETWALRTLAVLVLTQVVYVKIIDSPGLYSMLSGFALAAILAKIRTRLSA